MKKYLILILTIVVFTLTGCASNEDAYIYEGDAYNDVALQGTSGTPDHDFDVNANGGEVLNSPDIPVLANRKIIYTANMSLISLEPETVYNNVIGDLVTYSAYIEAENITSTKYVITIRVLSENLMDFVDAIKLEGDVLNYSKTSEDITNAYSTYEARLTALQAEHARILEFIEVAETLDDLLTLEAKRVQLETELNQIGLQLATYDSLVDYSTINLTIIKVEDISDILERTTNPNVYVNQTGTTYFIVEVHNNSEKTATLYLNVKQNGELIREYEEEAYGGGSYKFEVIDLDSNEEYVFEAFSLENNHTVSLISTRVATTESTFATRVGSTFTNSVDSLVSVFQFFGIVITALLPYGIVAGILYYPTRVLYIKVIKPRRLIKKELLIKRIEARTSANNSNKTKA
jgi:hypothetical protein